SGADPSSFNCGDDLVQYIDDQLGAGRAVTFGTNDGGPLVGGHVYSVVDAYDDPNTGEPIVEVRNPWGSDGPNSDGYNWYDAGDVINQMNGICSADVSSV